MKNFEDKIAVVTGGGTGMGRELVIQLARAGAHVAMCDVMEDNMVETLAKAREDAPNVRISAHVCDVSVESDVVRFREAVEREHETDHINLLFNNAGIGGGGSFVDGDRQEWEKTFGVCWYGVYFCAREFVPLLVASDEGHIVNTSSVNGFWATLGMATPHTAYSAAKFAVKGFSEALIHDLRLNAPHVKVSVVMPGHIGTSIAINTGKVLGKGGPMDLTDEEVETLRERWVSLGMPLQNESNEQIRQRMREQQEAFRDNAPTSAAQAANIILDAVRNEKWRVLVGEDAHRLDSQVRETPEEAYEESFLERLRASGTFGGILLRGRDESAGD